MKLLICLILIVIAALVALRLRLSPDLAVGAAVMPGPVTKAHAEYEDNCSECHSPFDKEAQSNLCAGCHEEVREDMDSGRGYHGRSSYVLEKPCKSCHTEHIGRGGSIVSLDTRTFDHNLTDFQLAGTHARASIACDACHENGKKFRESPTDCLGCHSDADSHEGQLGADCASCHKETSWNEISFDHDTTCFPLTGKHREASCDSCHPDKVYLSTLSNCNACHLMKDIHDSKLDENCDRCHDTDSWQGASFDHDVETEFRLEDRHTDLDCRTCHTDFVFRKNPGTECVNCHEADDIHKGKVGLNCGECHSEVAWDKVAFDHNCDTGFELSGRHAKIQCADCHKRDLQAEKSHPACNFCHKAEDVHKEQLGLLCDLCHNTDGWKERIAFDHDITNFPLIGLHAVVACGECHLSSAFRGTDAACTSCHDGDDYHKGALGVECGSCHNPNGWRLWVFDHGVKAGFKLEGAHAKLECNACHVSRVRGKIELSQACSSCHSDDDVHYRRFGRQCDRCHTVESFKKIRMGG